MIPLFFSGMIYVGLCNWLQIRYLFGSLFHKEKLKLKNFENKQLLLKMQNKTKLPLSIKVMDNKKKMIGFMVSSPPFQPVMIFSEKLIRSFTDDEMQWVILHESAHYLMWHNAKFAMTQLIYLLPLIFIHLYFHLHIFMFFLASIILAIIYIQTVKYFEYQADKYAAQNMDNPKGMISGNIKMKDANTGFLGRSVIRKLFTIAVPYEERIKMAQERLHKE